jgi:hypothetical protein
VKSQLRGGAGGSQTKKIAIDFASQIIADSGVTLCTPDLAHRQNGGRVRSLEIVVNNSL